MERNRQCRCAATPPEDTGDEDFVLGAVESDGKDAFGDGCWCWQSMAYKPAKWVVPQWEMLAADSGSGGQGRRGWGYISYQWNSTNTLLRENKISFVHSIDTRYSRSKLASYG
jgi:hypothetical protein